MTALIITVISLAVAVACDYLVSIMLKTGVRNIFSSAVAGMIVALSFSSGIPYSPSSDLMMNPINQYIAVAVISAVTVLVFKKAQGLLGRKYVNPAATAKLLVLAPILSTALLPADHSLSYFNITLGSGLKDALTMCYSSTAPFQDPLLTLTILKNHGWLGGASSITVIAVGVALILLTRGYIKWRIPLSYLVTLAIISAGYGLINGEDVVLRVFFHLFVGSVIFLAFFMATDPATTPLTAVGQIIFAVGVGVLTFVFQMYLLFLGGSILALVIMNLTTPILDKIGLPKPVEKRITRERSKAKEFETASMMDCIRCGKCLVSCRRNLAPILIKEAVDKGNWAKVKSLNAEHCIACPPNCQLCVDVCPTNALVMSGERQITVSPELCIYCKACQNICPRGEIHVTIDRILHLPIESATWVTVLERFASYKAAAKELAAKSKRKLRQTIESRAEHTTLEEVSS
jgi:electron transport complex protein RnfD